MANVLYNKFLAERDKGNVDLDAAGTVMRVMLERSTSTYSANKDHEFVDDLTNFVECSVASYARQTVANKLIEEDDTNDRSELHFDDVEFGALETGQIVKGYVIYLQTGGNDSSPADDLLVAYVDTATGLPATLGGGDFTLRVNAQGVLQTQQA